MLVFFLFCLFCFVLFYLFIYLFIYLFFFFLEKMEKKFFLVKNFCGKLKNNFELKVLKLLENHVKTQLKEHFFFQFLN